ncbi:MAG: hypothetical protein ACRCY8_13660 [Dermatophilaceae bacterium]
MITSVAVVPSAPALLPRYTGRVDALAGLRATAAEVVHAAAAAADRIVLVAATDREPRHSMAPLGQRVGEHLLSVAQARADDVLRGAPPPEHPPNALVLVPWDASPTECHVVGGELATSGTASAHGIDRASSEPGGGRASAPGGETALLGGRSEGEARRTTLLGGHPEGGPPRTAASALVVVADGSARRGEKAPGHLDERALAFDEALVSALRDADPAALLALDAALAVDVLAHGRAPLQVAAGAMASSTARTTRMTRMTRMTRNPRNLRSDASGLASTPDVHGVDESSAWTCERLEVSDQLGVLHVVALLHPAG